MKLQECCKESVRHKLNFSTSHRRLSLKAGLRKILLVFKKRPHMRVEVGWQSLSRLVSQDSFPAACSALSNPGPCSLCVLRSQHKYE